MNHRAEHHVFSHEISDFIHTSRGTYALCMIIFLWFLFTIWTKVKKRKKVHVSFSQFLEALNSNK